MADREEFPQVTYEDYLRAKRLSYLGLAIIIGRERELSQKLAAKEAELDEALKDALDHLTGLPRRKAFERDAEKVLAAIDNQYRPGDPIGAVMFGIDFEDFVKFNDHLGEEGGDLALVAGASHLAKAVRDSDLLARFGGDEFYILAPTAPGSTDEAVYENIADRLYDIPQDPNFPRRIRWNYAFRRGKESLTDFRRRADINSRESKERATYSELNELYPF
jgi:diguanylate cyclase (GGDEF)-like protein